MNKQNIVYKYNEILFGFKKEGNSDIYNMDEPWGHYAKWNKSNTKGQILFWFHLNEVPKIVKFRERNCKGSCHGVGGGTMGSYCLMGTELKFCKMSSVDG